MSVLGQRNVKRIKSSEDIPPIENSAAVMSLPLKMREALAYCGDGLCDAKLMSVDGQQFNINRGIIAEFSPFMRSIFLQNLDSEIYNVDVFSETLKNILYSIYDDHLNVNRTNLEELIKASIKLSFRSVMERCYVFMDQDTNLHTAIHYRKLAEKYNCSWLRYKKTDYILDNFGVISRQSLAFLDLSCDDLLDFLKSDGLRANQEKEAYEAVMKWVNHDVMQRGRSVPILLNKVKLSLCSTEYLGRVISKEPLVVKNPLCKAMLRKCNKYVTSKNGRLSDILNANIYHARPRIPREIIFVIGGWFSGHASSVIETYDVRSDRWLWVPYSDSMPRAYHGVVELNGLIYCVGGFDGRTYYNSMRVFCPITHVWKEKGCMSTPRCYVSVVALNGSIYAMGGFDGRVRTNSCEKYDPKDNQWSPIAEMSTPRSDANATVIQNKIYIVGGFTGNHVLKTGEVYDPETNQWTAIPEMARRRSGLGVITYRNQIYVLGGFDGHNRINTGQRYNPQTQQWSNISTMTNSRSNFATVVLEDHIYVIGGFRGNNNTLALVERYSEDTNQWQTVGSMTYNRSALNACVISGLGPIRAKEYSYLGS